MTARLPTRLLGNLAGVILGYGTSLLTTLAWFLWTHHTPTDPAPIPFMAATAACSIVFALLGGWLSAAISGSSMAAYAVAILIVMFSLLAFILTHSAASGHDSRWWLPIVVVLVGPAAALGGSIRSTNRD